MKTSQSSSCNRFSFLALILLFPFAPPASAADFGSLPVAFSEDMIGEATSPSTPEVDLLGTSGLELLDATYTGTAAHLMVDFVTLFSSTSRFELVDIEGISTHGSDHGFRAEFENLTFSGTVDGTANLFVGAFLPAVGAGDEIQIVAALFVTTNQSNGDFLTIYMEQVNPDDPGNPYATSSVELSQADATAIISGAPVRLDLFIYDSNGSAVAEVEIDGVPVFGIGQLSLVNYGNQTLGSAIYGLTTFFVTGDPLIDVDLTLAEAYANVRPLSFEPLFNIDMSVAYGVPGSGFGAAGGAGEWNGYFFLGGLALTDVNGVATSVNTTLSSEGIVNSGLGLPDLGALLADSTIDCNDPDQWSLDFTGLTDGIYKIIFYAPNDTTYQTGDISIDGNLAIDSLPGIMPDALVEGTSWGSTFAVVSGGTLSIDGFGTGAVQCAGLAGVQLEFGSPIVAARLVPFLEIPALLGLVASLLIALRIYAPKRLCVSRVETAILLSRHQPSDPRASRSR